MQPLPTNSSGSQLSYLLLSQTALKQPSEHCWCAQPLPSDGSLTALYPPAQVGDAGNLLKKASVLYNIGEAQRLAAQAHFAQPVFVTAHADLMAAGL